MIWLLLSIICSTGLFLTFKYFGKFQVLIFPAIVFNYVTCFICGNIHLGNENLFSTPVWNEPWLPRIAFLGIFFISTFYFTGLGTKMAGAGPTSVASKMSVALPALYAIIFWKESFGWVQYAGIALSLVSVYLVTPDTPEEHKNHRALWILLIVFLGSGIVDTGLNIFKHDYRNLISDQKISTIVFGMAGLIGITILALRYKHHPFGKKEIAGGIILGIINYLSLIAMFSALDAFNGKTALFFAINNVGVVIFSTVAAVLIFKEAIYRKEKLGLLLAVIAIFLMNFYAVF